MGATVPLGRIGIKVLDEVERGIHVARTSAPAGAPIPRLRAAAVSIPFATADGSAAQGAVFPAHGGAGKAADARAWLLGLSAPALSAMDDIAAADPAARGVLVLRVDFE